MTKKKMLRSAMLGLTLTGQVFVTPRTANADADPDHKVTICHYPPGNPENFHEITVDWSAVPTHVLLHGDIVGGCRIG
jgi:hypothetical protein